MLPDSIPTISDFPCKRFRNQGIRVVLQHLPAAGEEAGRKEIKVIEVAEQKFDAVTLVSHFDVGRSCGAEERCLLHLRNVLLKEFGLIEASGQIIAKKRERIDPIIIPIPVVDIPQIVHITHQGDDKRERYAYAQKLDKRI